MICMLEVQDQFPVKHGAQAPLGMTPEHRKNQKEPQELPGAAPPAKLKIHRMKKYFCVILMLLEFNFLGWSPLLCLTVLIKEAV